MDINVIATICFVLVITLGVESVGSFATCNFTYTERAYSGPYEIDFPRDCKTDATPYKCWLIKAYRKGYVVQLSFNNVNITRDERTHACVDQIIVHDGTDRGSAVLASFCGVRNPELMTSRRYALIVFSSNRTHGIRGRFKVKYRAVKDRSGEGDSFALSFAFGGSIGAIALVVACSGVVRRYKLSQRGQTSFFLFRRPRANNNNSNATNARGNANTTHASTRNGQRAGAGRGDTSTSGGGDAQPPSFRQRVARFFQSVLRLKTNQNGGESSSLEPDSQRSNQRARRRSRDRRSANPSSSCPHRQRSNSLSSSRYPDFSLATCSSDAMDVSGSCQPGGHEAFGYRDIPVSSFTSDPDEVRPPTYEDSINRVNPLYLCHYGGASVHYNRAFDMKDEGGEYMFSPPPPYTEINRQTVDERNPAAASTTTQAQTQQSQSQQSAPAQEVILEPVENLRTVSSDVERTASTSCMSNHSDPSEIENIIDQESSLQSKELDLESIQDIDLKEGVEKDNILCDQSLNKKEISHGILDQEHFNHEVNLPEPMSVNEASDESTKHNLYDSARNDSPKIEEILVDSVSTNSRQHTSPRSEDRDRQTVTIPLDMMRRSGLKTSKSDSPKHQGLTAVEECQPFDHLHDVIDQRHTSDGAGAFNISESVQDTDTSSDMPLNHVSGQTDDLRCQEEQNENSSSIVNRNREQSRGVRLTTQGEIDL